MITAKDLDEAIMECQGKRNPDASTCLKLAAFYTIKQHLYPQQADDAGTATPRIEGDYSYSRGPEITYSGESDFARAVYGRDQLDVLQVVDELMETLKVINPRLYSGVMRRLE